MDEVGDEVRELARLRMFGINKLELLILLIN
jgi:hypothetical protein